MARDVEQYCRECTKCQQSKLSMPPLTSLPIGRPWQMVVVDILEVPLSTNNNRYLLVVQDYYTKWEEVLHSDQGRNFESSILPQTLESFGVHNFRTTPYHPQRDGMVERFNRSLLQLLRTYVDAQSDWERYLPLVLYAYRTSVHSSTDISPFVLMFGCHPWSMPFAKVKEFDSQTYPAHLQAKQAELRDFVEANLAKAAHHQKCAYDQHTSSWSFLLGILFGFLSQQQGSLTLGGRGNGLLNR